MSHCPADLKPCIDDLCHGGGCFRLDGEPMLTPCPGCSVLVAKDGSSEDCECEPFVDDEDPDFWFDDLVIDSGPMPDFLRHPDAI